MATRASFYLWEDGLGGAMRRQTIRKVPTGQLQQLLDSEPALKLLCEKAGIEYQEQRAGIETDDR